MSHDCADGVEANVRFNGIKGCNAKFREHALMVHLGEAE